MKSNIAELLKQFEQLTKEERENLINVLKNIQKKEGDKNAICNL